MTRQVTKEAIRLYAEASGDFNPIHVDDAFAAKTQFGGVIAHGMMMLAYASSLMAAEFGSKWNEYGIMRVRFKGPARPGDTLSLVAEKQDDETVSDRRYIKYALACRNDKDQPVIDGQLLVPA
jgi:3-hydroxybutyryl-CoA dehydratase